MRSIPLFAVALAALAAPLAARDCWRPDAFDGGGASAAPIAPGTHTGLTLRSDPNRPDAAVDRYTIDVPAQSRLTLALRATSPYGPSPANAGVPADGALLTAVFEGWFRSAASGFDQPFRVYPDGTIPPPEFGTHLDPFFENDTSSTQAVEFFVRASDLHVYGCVEYEMVVDVSARPCNVAPDDWLEGPDDCATASVLPDGLSEGLITFDDTVLGGEDRDYYRIPDVQPGESLSLTLQLEGGALGPIEMILTDDAACDAPWSSATTAFARNDTAAAKDYYLVVGTYSDYHLAGPEAPGCKVYDLHLARIADACGALPVDAFEPNSSCAQAATITSGNYPGLTLDGTDDFFEVVVPPQQQLQARTFGHPAVAQVGMSAAFAPDCPDDWPSDQLNYINTNATPVTIVIRVDSAVSMCASYDLELLVGPPTYAPGYVPQIDPGDTCATAVDLPEGTRPLRHHPVGRSLLAYEDFSLAPGSEDYLRVVVRPNDTYVVFLQTDSTELRLEAVELGDCGGPPTPGVLRRQGIQPLSELYLENPTGAHRTFVLRVFGTAQHASIEPYTLGYYRGRPCDRWDFDAASFEQSNTSCASAPVVPAASVGYQQLETGEARFVRTSVPAGRTLSAVLEADTLYRLGSEVVLAMHDGEADCDVGGAALGATICTTDGSVNSASWTNAGSQDREVVVEVRFADHVVNCGQVWLDLALDDGASYTVECLGLDASGLACPCGNQLATPDGGGCTNSAGRSARLAATGTAGVVADDFLIEVAELPPHRMGLVLVETLDPFFASLPFGQSFYDGKLCVGATMSTGVLRVAASSQGAWQGAVPLAGLIGATAGQRHRVQVWYRDAGGPCGAGSNTTNAIRVEWMP